MKKEDAIALAKQLASQTGKILTVWRMPGWSKDQYGVTYLRILPDEAIIVEEFGKAKQVSLF